ncbi:MAG: hypothetical protein K2X77_03210 [Candidatus Obscuribacterales bacterium]|jgi:hypothetical protein|nr:hypothetical protein [Candidatus Obscuribacterales bacterium]
MMTYESASEAQILKAYWRPGAPLENTVFAITDPWGRIIMGGGRSPKWVFRDSAEMARTMDEIARHYKGESGLPDGLPSVDTVRLAIDVAACDKRPLAVVVGKNSEERQQLTRNLASIAWSDQFIGKLVYSAGTSFDLKNVRGATTTNGYVFIAPNLFGTEGTALMQLPANASISDLQRAAQLAITKYRPQVLSHHDHVRLGHMEGIEWQTAIPVTDPHSPPRRRFP